MATDYTYVGSELELFAGAIRWKSYIADQVTPFLGEEVLEVGAGLGGTSKRLCRGIERRWVCLEPDEGLAGRLSRAIDTGELPACCRVEVGTLERLARDPAFDTVLYIDVMEHIEDDAGEMARAGEFLRPGGHVVVLAPAHQWLYSPFDEAIGHHRRYTRSTLRALTPTGLDLVRLSYLDAVGLIASAGNRLLLRRAMPTSSQIAVWDRYMVRLSRVFDPLIGFSVGKSVLGVWRKRSR